MSPSNIAWTISTWNPVLGCDRVSEGCRLCYALAETWRKSHHPDPVIRQQYEGLVHPLPNGQLDWTGVVKLIPERLPEPLDQKKPTLYFVNSMSDLFHEQLSLEDIRQVFEVMRLADWHVFQVLTKRADRLLELSPQLDWPTNLWMGVSVESKKHLGRVDCLRRCRAAVKFLSLEPLLTELPDLNLEGIDWVIVGGESDQFGLGVNGRARAMSLDWVRAIRDQCRQAGVAFFSKQLGSVWARANKAQSKHGAQMEEWPEDLRVQEWPRGVRVVGGKLVTQIEGMTV